MSVTLQARRFLKSIPLFSGLADARWRDHREAIKEVSVNIVLSTAPIWLGCIFLAVGRKFEMPFYEVVIKNVENGEMFLYATSMTAPIYYFIFKDESGLRRFPNAGSFMLIAAIILLIGGCGFALTRLGSVLEMKYRWDDNILFLSSLSLYVFAVFVVYLAHAYRNWHETGGSVAFTSDTQDFVAQFNREAKS